MTGNPMKPRQKRLDGYVLPKPKRAIIGEKLGERACHNLKIAVFAGDGHRRLESTGENRQSRHNTMLLGEYRFIFQKSGLKPPTSVGKDPTVRRRRSKPLNPSTLVGKCSVYLFINEIEEF